MTTTTIEIPGVRLVNGQNCREHWSKRSKRAREQRLIARTHTHVVVPALAKALCRRGCIITITRIGPRTMDRDGNIASMKAVIDGIADALGMDDADPRIDWRYAQEKQKAYGVRIRIESLAQTQKTDQITHEPRSTP